MNKTTEALKLAHSFCGELVTFGGKYPYVNGTEVVMDAYKISAALREALAEHVQEPERKCNYNGGTCERRGCISGCQADQLCSINNGLQNEQKRVLDPCCGSRMMWFDREHRDVIFGDRRTEVLTVTDNSRGNKSGQRVIRIEPDTTLDFRDLPYQDGSFKLVAFDPPHLIQAGPRSWLAAKYGKLSDNWRDDLRQGFAECFRVLDSDGVLVFKWNETQVKLSEVLALTPHAPLFGHTSGKKAGTHWLVFMKPCGDAA